MNEENSTSTGGARPKKKRSFWFLKLLLILIVFTGGIVLGLKLYTMPEPSALLNRYVPKKQKSRRLGARSVGRTNLMRFRLPCRNPQKLLRRKRPDRTERPLGLMLR